MPVHFGIYEHEHRPARPLNFGPDPRIKQQVSAFPPFPGHGMRARLSDAAGLRREVGPRVARRGRGLRCGGCGAAAALRAAGWGGISHPVGPAVWLLVVIVMHVYACVMEALGFHLMPITGRDTLVMLQLGRASPVLATGPELLGEVKLPLQPVLSLQAVIDKIKLSSWSVFFPGGWVEGHELADLPLPRGLDWLLAGDSHSIGWDLMLRGSVPLRLEAGSRSSQQFLLHALDYVSWICTVEDGYTVDFAVKLCSRKPHTQAGAKKRQGRGPARFPQEAPRRKLGL